MGKDDEEMLARQVAYWDWMYKEITKGLHDNDVHMVKYYLLNVRLSINVCYVFEPEDYVLLQRGGGTNYQSK